MRALTIRQPWAGLIAYGRKTVEFRKRRAVSMVGKRFAVHAAKTTECPLGMSDRLQAFAAVQPHGAVVAVARIATCRLMNVQTDRSIPGCPRQTCWAWVLAPDVFVLDPPVYCSGFQGWWRLPPDVEREVLRQLEETDA